MSRSTDGFNSVSCRSLSRGDDLAGRFFRDRAALRRLPHRLVRQLPVITGLKSSGKFTDGQENVILKIGEALRDSRAIYRHEDDILYVYGTRAATIFTVGGVDRSASGHLANVLLFREETKTRGANEFLPSISVLNAVFRNRTVLEMLPTIEYLATTPTFGPDFILLQGPGFHDCGIMVLAQPVEPEMFTVTQRDRAIDRLPPLLRRLLGRFCFRSNADVANTLSVLLTAVLMNHCADFARPMVFVDGNRPNVGKTVLIQSLGAIIDGEMVSAIPYVPNEEELQKRIIARLQRSRGHLLFLDNAKSVAGNAVSSPVLESLSSDPVISGRILGTSNEVAIKNVLLFAMTMNGTNISPDLLSRSLPIQLHYEDGDPRYRNFGREDPFRFAREHRDGILAELLGMVDYWIGQGRPTVDLPHRCHQWAALIGSILHSCGFPEFLTNFDTAAEEFNAQTEELREIFRAVSSAHAAPVAVGETSSGETVRIPAAPLPPGEWATFLRNIQGHADVLGRANGDSGLGMRASRILKSYENCQFEYADENGNWTVILRSASMRGRQKGFFFEAAFQALEPDEMDAPATVPEEIPM